jgi:TatA/E family protein of Tat protein translocase
MFGFGGLSEVLFILFIAMLIFGPEKLPEIGRMLAKGMAEVRKASNELKRTLNAELAVSEQDKEAARLREASFPPPPPPAPPAWSGAAGSSEGAARDEAPAGSQIAENSEAAERSDAAYFAAWPEDGSSPAPVASAGSLDPAAPTPAPAASEDSRAPAADPDSAARAVPAGTVAQG